MKIALLKSKLHRVRCTRKELAYEGSLAVDRGLMDAAGLLPFERIEVFNVTNGERWSTYIIPSETPGEVALNGAAARKGEVGDELIVVSYAWVDPSHPQLETRIVLVDETNRIREVRTYRAGEHGSSLSG